MTNEKNHKLFSEFPEVSTGEWEEQIHTDLKGADYQKKLVRQTLDGITVQPYYRAEDIQNLPESGNPGSFPYLRGTKTAANSWLVRQDIPFTQADETGARIKYLMGRGVQSIGLHFDQNPEVGSLIQLLDGIPLEQLELNFRKIHPGIALEAIRSFFQKTGFNKAILKGSLGYDPLGDFTLSGILEEEEALFDALAGWIAESKEFPGLRIIEVHARNFHNAGSTTVQELGYGLSQATEYLDQLTDRDLAVNEVLVKMSFSFAVGSDYFFELAKFRAARALWSKVVECFDREAAISCKPYIHAETSSWNTTVYDPYVNLLRSTTEAMSSILGGIDSLTVLPFNASYTEPDEIAQRLARNQQLVLREEAYLDQVVDPAAGSYYIEHLTNSLIETSWELFRATEAQGGYVDAFLEGSIQDAITGVAQKRDLNLALRQEVLLGTNQYSNAGESQFAQTDVAISHPPAADTTKALTQPLNLYRGAEEFEKLRFDVEQAARQPIVFLLPIGNLTLRKARASFASNFFGCAGYQIMDNLGFETVEKGVRAAQEAQADILVLCSSDEEYQTLAPAAVKIAGGMEVVVAGYPKEIVNELQQAGIRHFIHLKSNVLDTLRGFNQLLGIRK